MDELIKALGPWPLLQGIALGTIVAATGAWAIRKGLQSSRKSDVPIEDMRAEWAAYEQLRHIHENSFEIVECLKRSNDLAAQILAALNRFNDMRWNLKQ